LVCQLGGQLGEGGSLYFAKPARQSLLRQRRQLAIRLELRKKCEPGPSADQIIRGGIGRGNQGQVV
jgi:hypothetical protein